jgi:hypothetical protein
VALTLVGDSHLTDVSSRWPTTKLPARLATVGFAVEVHAEGGLTSGAALAQYPTLDGDAVLCSLGTNDMAAWKRVETGNFQRNYRELVRRAAGRPFLGLTPPLDHG